MTQADDAAAPVRHVLICGSGLAAHVTAAALSHQLPPAMKITFADIGDASGTDLFYGNVVGPSAYAFNRSAGLSEPALVLESDAAFSWGTKYSCWAGGSRSWIQCYELPLPIIDGVLFHHYLAQQRIDRLDPYIVSASAARKGAFAHPEQPGQGPKGGPNIFSRSEYGYQFDPASYARLFEASADRTRIRRISGQLADIQCNEGGIASIRLSNGQTLQADLYVDCTGPDALLLSALGTHFSGGRQLLATMHDVPASQLGAPVRTVTPRPYGWQADIPVQGRLISLAISDPDTDSVTLPGNGKDAVRSGNVTLGRRAKSWSGNCVSLGQAACVVEPLTIAPMRLLERDVERLVSLIPVSTDMSVEAREYNRRSAEDHEHAELFTRALFETDNLPDTPYWRAARAEPVSEKLARKLKLFAERGFLVAYDLEPFHAEDWTILHYGMGRVPQRYDRYVDRARAAQIENFLTQRKNSVEKLVETLPSHAAYMTRLQQYLRQNKR